MINVCTVHGETQRRPSSILPQRLRKGFTEEKKLNQALSNDLVPK